MARTVVSQSSPPALNILCGIALVAALYFSSDILLPFGLAVLLSFLLAPFARRLEKRKVPRIPAVLIVMSLALALVSVLSWVMLNQLYDLARKLPDYKANLTSKFQVFQGEGADSFQSLSDGLSNLFRDFTPPRQKEITKAIPSPSAGRQAPGASPGPTPAAADPATPEPIQVEVVDRLSFPEILPTLLGPVLGPLGIAAIVIVFMIFMLIEREDLRNRLIYLVGSRQINSTTQAIDDAGRRVSRYLMMQFFINTAFGAVIALGLLAIGLPNALLWGCMAMFLRFIPFIGPWISALIVISMSLAFFDGWHEPMLVLGLFIANELVSNNVLEPWLYGASTGISKTGILISALFWTWLWGPVGLIMATPLTVCLTVMARYMPPLAFINKLLSTEETMPPHERFYQRLLALDSEEAVSLVDDFMEKNTLDAVYDQILMPALVLAKRDRHLGALEDFRQQLIVDTIRELVEDLGERAALAPVNSPPAPTRKLAVLCLPARDESDELASLMLSQLLEAHGVKAVSFTSKTLVGEVLTQVETAGANLVCVASLPPFAASHARYLCKRLRPKFPDLRIVVGFWPAPSGGSAKKIRECPTLAGIDKCVATLAEAVQIVTGNGAADSRFPAAAVPAQSATLPPSPAHR